MKRTILAFAAIVIAGAPFALAQEEEAPAASPEASASRTTEKSSSDPSVSVTTEKTTPAPKPSRSPGPTKSSSPEPKSSPSKSSSPEPKSSPTKSSSPTEVAPVKKSSPEAMLREMEDKWEASVMAHDPSVAQAYLADDFRGVSSKGKIMKKGDLLAEMKKDTDTYTSAKNSKLDVRIFDGKFAVATAIATEEGKAKDGKAFKRSFRWTDAWVLRDGKWQCVASQAMLVK
jgi:outer membrane biosynthesis protein TonB